MTRASDTNYCCLGECREAQAAPTTPTYSPVESTNLPSSPTPLPIVSTPAQSTSTTPPWASVTPSPKPSASNQPTPTSSPSATPTAGASPSPTPAPTATPTSTPTATPTGNPFVSPTATPTANPGEPYDNYGSCPCAAGQACTEDYYKNTFHFQDACCKTGDCLLVGECYPNNYVLSNTLKCQSGNWVSAS
ncbi:MAG: hypothetical protein V1834_04185 [Candidatus Micrarchaeota archaeon]